MGPLLGDAAPVMPVRWIDDAKSLVSHLENDSGQVADRRVRVVIAALREMLVRDGTSLTWVDTSVQLADALTKWDAERGFLAQTMRTGIASLRVPPQAVVTKAAVRAGRHRRADAARASRFEKGGG